jgi:hypothetical protein
VTSADFNGDSKIDLAIANAFSNNLSILNGLGSGAFVSAGSYSLGLSPKAICYGNFNGDSYLDLAVANFYSDNVSILLGASMGSFSSAVDYSVNVRPCSIATADCNADGKLDLITSNSNYGGISILLGTGLGVFGNYANYGIVGDPTFVAPSDFNNDGKIDLAIANNGGTTAFLSDIPTINFVGNSKICYGDSLTIIASGANTYSWSTGVLTNSISISPFSTTNYTIIGMAVTGCSNIAVTTVEVNQLPIITVMSQDSVVCVGNSSILTANGANTYSWSSGSSIATQTISPTSTTDYTVVGTDTNGCSSLTIFTQSVSTCIGIKELTTNNIITIFPNPTEENLYVEVENPNTTLNIFSTLGKLVLSESLVNLKNQINIKELSNGIYIIKIIDSNRIISISKIVKE